MFVLIYILFFIIVKKLSQTIWAEFFIARIEHTLGLSLKREIFVLSTYNGLSTDIYGHL